jgi:CBS domain-containing protein
MSNNDTNLPAYVKIGDVMTGSVQTIGRMDTIKTAVQMMRESNVSSLAVERRDEQDEYGLLVVSDIARDVVGKNRSPDRVNVYEVMSKPVLSLSKDMDVKYAVRLLVKFKLSRALVMNAAREPIGIVTLRDMVLGHVTP